MTGFKSSLPILILTTYNDGEYLNGWYTNLMKSLKTRLSFGLICVDAGSTDNSVNIMEKVCPVIGPHNQATLYKYLKRTNDDFKDLSRATNIGIELALMDNPRCIGWIHPDMDFYNEGKGVGWLEGLIGYMEVYPNVGKVSPEIEPSSEFGERSGHQCPWLLSTKVIQKLKKQDKYVFDERYLLCGGYEDWDLCKRILDLGYEVMIAGKSRIKHESMGTRRKYDNNMAARYNASLFQQKWGQCAPFV